MSNSNVKFILIKSKISEKISVKTSEDALPTVYDNLEYALEAIWDSLKNLDEVETINIDEGLLLETYDLIRRKRC